jgi:energy-coupling factor transport system ATP-binding protein
MSVILILKDFSFTYPETQNAVLRSVSLEIEAGSCYCLTGPTGSGKTTLALALKGLLGEGSRSGRIDFPLQSGDEEMSIGIVLQDPEVQLLTSTVGAEVAFGLENLCVDPSEMPGRVAAALEAVGLDKPLHSPVDLLSMGQKYRLLVAAMLVMEPKLLILDEPGAQLDPEGLERLHEILGRLKAAGVAVVLCEHRPEPLSGVIDAFWQLDGEGALRSGRWQNSNEEIVPPPLRGSRFPGEQILQVAGLSFAGADEQPVWSEVSFSVARGQRVAVTGLNGTGKTTLLRCLAGFLEPSAGQVRILGGAPDPYRLRGRLGCLFQNPQKQLFENTVREEIAFPLKRFGLSGREAARHVEEALDACAISHLAELSPHKLSYGQKHLVALASMLAPRPELLLLDDPLAGLDGRVSREVMELLVRWSLERETAMVWTSHDPGAWPDWADRVMRLEGGRLGAV